MLPATVVGGFAQRTAAKRNWFIAFAVHENNLEYHGIGTLPYTRESAVVSISTIFVEQLLPDIRAPAGQQVDVPPSVGTCFLGAYSNLAFESIPDLEGLRNAPKSPRIVIPG